MVFLSSPGQLVHLKFRFLEAGLKVFEEVCFGGKFTGTMINWEKDTIFLNTDLGSSKRLSSCAEEQGPFRECRHLALNRVCFWEAIFPGSEPSWFSEHSRTECCYGMTTPLNACHRREHLFPSPLHRLNERNMSGREIICYTFCSNIHISMRSFGPRN